MAPTVQWGEPERARAGDTWLWKATFTEYPDSEGWTPKYIIRGVGALVWDDTWRSNSGEEWTFTIPAASTAGLAAGGYEWALILTGSGTYAGREHTVRTGTIEVLPDLEAAAPGARQSHEEKMIPLLEAAIEALVSGKAKHYIIGNRQVTYNDLAELRSTLGVYKAKRYRKRTGRFEIPVRVVM